MARRGGQGARAIAVPQAGSRGIRRGAFGGDVVTLLRGWLAAEAGAGRLLPWVPVAFGTGIALYFAADNEPIVWVVAPVAIASLALVVALRGHRRVGLAILGAALVCGFAVATLKARIIAHGVLARPAYAAAIQGYVETREERERTDRFVLRLTAPFTSRGGETLSRVRISVKKGTAPVVGSHVTLNARLLPPLQPLLPGGYDFARDLYFQRIGASGFAMGPIATSAPPDGEMPGWTLRQASVVSELRDAIDRRIRAVLSGDNRAIATALLTGRRDALTPATTDAMFISGLGHILSISGYHMALVAGLVFFATRLLLALSPRMSADRPIKAWAAGAALAAATFYLVLSGAEVATQRSYVMTAVVLIAVIVHRRAITFRTLALAAMAVLMVAPEALVHPSFQMSFAATLGLVALVQGGWPGLFATPDHGATARIALWGGREIAMLTLASLIAGLATLPYAAFHFHRVTSYGVVANLAAMPIVSALVMPAGLLGLIAAPFGLDAPFWRLMGWGLDWMVGVSTTVAAWPGAVARVPAFGASQLALASLGIIILGLLRSPLRWSGAALLIVAGVLASRVPQPDILVASDARTLAVRAADGRLRIARTGRDTFLPREWLAADGDDRSLTDTRVSDGISCDALGCVVPLPDGKLAALATTPAALADDCRAADLLVTPFAPPKDCKAQVIATDTLRRDGTLALYRTAEGFVPTRERASGARPWSPPRAASASAVSAPAAPASDVPRPAARPPDATPDTGDLDQSPDQ